MVRHPPRTRRDVRPQKTAQVHSQIAFQRSGTTQSRLKVDTKRALFAARQLCVTSLSSRKSNFSYVQSYAALPIQMSGEIFKIVKEQIALNVLYLFLFVKLVLARHQHLLATGSAQYARRPNAFIVDCLTPDTIRPRPRFTLPCTGEHHDITATGMRRNA